MEEYFPLNSIQWAKNKLIYSNLLVMYKYPVIIILQDIPIYILYVQEVVTILYSKLLHKMSHYFWTYSIIKNIDIVKRKKTNGCIKCVWQLRFTLLYGMTYY